MRVFSINLVILSMGSNCTFKLWKFNEYHIHVRWPFPCQVDDNKDTV